MDKYPIRPYALPILCAVITLYFVYHGIQGARGYRRMRQIQSEIVLASQIAAETRAEKELWQAKVQSLSPGSFDMDALEEAALRVLNMGRRDDYVVF